MSSAKRPYHRNNHRHAEAHAKKGEKRLFFGISMESPWPEKLPPGRLIPPESRHATLVFLGSCCYDTLSLQLPLLPLPPSNLGFTGVFTQCLFLPPREPRVVAWQAHFLGRENELARYQYRLQEWLLENGHLNEEDNRPWLPHVTVCRAPFQADDWEKSFEPLPFMVRNLHLYESVGGLNYLPLWTYPLESPFELDSTESTWKIKVNGRKQEDLSLHLLCGMAFLEPMLSNDLRKIPALNGLREAAAFIEHWLKERLQKERPTVTKLLSSQALSETNWLITLQKSV